MCLRRCFHLGGQSPEGLLRYRAAKYQLQNCPHLFGMSGLIHSLFNTRTRVLVYVTMHTNALSEDLHTALICAGLLGTAKIINRFRSTGAVSSTFTLQRPSTTTIRNTQQQSHASPQRRHRPAPPIRGCLATASR